VTTGLRPFILTEPTAPAAPLVVDSPHSGMTWPTDWRPAAPRSAILTTWDAYVGELWAGAPASGATLLEATVPRAYIDFNRAESDIDESLLAEPWPGPVAVTDYTQRGMGLVRRNALPGVPMYDSLLSIEEVRGRIAGCYRPYREALRARLDALHAVHGAVWHINCHSMKSRGNAMNIDAGAERPDVVVSDRHGTAADSALTAWAAQWFQAAGLRVSVNTPYQGGDLVRTFGAPRERRHSLQIELNRALYLDEAAVERGARFAEIRALCAAFTTALVARVRSELGST
jgi:N-formylglutamate deformylase